MTLALTLRRAALAAAIAVLPAIAPAQDGLTINLSIPGDVLERATGAGTPGRPADMQALLRSRVTALRGQLGIADPGGALGYTCDSRTNTCTCDNDDPLDCIDLIASGECNGGLDGSDGNICVGQPGNCTCTWH